MPRARPSIATGWKVSLRCGVCPPVPTRTTATDRAPLLARWSLFAGVSAVSVVILGWGTFVLLFSLPASCSPPDRADPGRTPERPARPVHSGAECLWHVRRGHSPWPRHERSVDVAVDRPRGRCDSPARVAVLPRHHRSRLLELERILLLRSPSRGVVGCRSQGPRSPQDRRSDSSRRVGRAFSWYQGARPRPGERRALPRTPDAQLVYRSTRWRGSVSP